MADYHKTLVHIPKHKTAYFQAIFLTETLAMSIYNSQSVREVCQNISTAFLVYLVVKILAI